LRSFAEAHFNAPPRALFLINNKEQEIEQKSSSKQSPYPNTANLLTRKLLPGDGSGWDAIFSTRFFTRLFTHQSNSNDASSSSRPERSAELMRPQAGQSQQPSFTEKSTKQLEQ
jgi:hypothetical protein